MTEDRIRVAVVGAGDVNRLYLPGLVGHPEVEVVAIGDRHPERARATAERYGVPRHGDVDAALDAGACDAVLNLTGPASHLSVTRDALENGLHVFSEKPLGTDLAEARSVLALAAGSGLLVACAPDTHLSPGFQDGVRLLDAGGIGEVVFSRCEAVLAGPESWHPRPQFLYARGGGPLFDIGPYYVTALVAVNGPVVRVHATGTRKTTRRVIGSGPDQGTEFPVEVPTLVCAVLEFANGTAGTLLLTFDSASHRGGSMEVLGTRGTLRTPDPNGHDGTAAVLDSAGSPWTEVPLGSTGGGRPAGVLNFVRSIRGTEELRVSGELALHVLEVLTAVDTSCRTGDAVRVAGSVERPTALPVGWNLAPAGISVPS